MSETTTRTTDPAATAVEQSHRLRPRRGGAYPRIALASEFLDAIRRELPGDHPVAPAVAALPTPVAYMNPDRSYTRLVITRRGVDRWLWPVVSRRDEATLRDVQAEHDMLDLSASRPEALEAAKRWAQGCANVLTEHDERALATQVSLLANAAIRQDDAGLARAAAAALVTARGSMGYLLLAELATTIHDLGFTDQHG